MRVLGSLQISITGDKELLAYLHDAQSLKEVKSAVRRNTTRLNKLAVKNAQFRGHYEGRGKNKRFVKPTGATRQSIKSDFQDGGLTGKVSAGTHYSGYLEVGTRKMEAQPFIKPALEVVEPKFIDDLKGVMK